MMFRLPTGEVVKSEIRHFWHCGYDFRDSERYRPANLRSRKTQYVSSFRSITYHGGAVTRRYPGEEAV
jgi:hypothetical protein